MRAGHLEFCDGQKLKSSQLAEQCARLNEAFNHWIVDQTPFVTIKSAMTLDGKIATAGGESKWITSKPARLAGSRLRTGADAILVGVNTILADNPQLTIRSPSRAKPKCLRRVILDSMARTPIDAKVVTDAHASSTLIVIGPKAPGSRVKALARHVKVVVAPLVQSKINLRWLLRHLGKQDIVHLLVEGGGEVNASFFSQRLPHRIAFFYAPKILGGRHSIKAVSDPGASRPAEILDLHQIQWRQVGPDLLLDARVRQ